MKKKLMVLVLSMVMFGVFTGSGFAGDCSTNYPILLVHGVALGDDTLGFDYYGRIPGYLRSYGAIVEGGGQDAWSDGADNAVQLKQKIEDVMDAYDVNKVNIIAHSKGAIDTRYMFKKFPSMKNHVASFTSVASPQKGSVLADIILGVMPDWAEPYIGGMLNVIGLIIQGDESPDSLAAGYQLLRSSMAAFNASFGDLNTGIDGVYCQSYAAKIKGVVLDGALQSTGVVMAIGGESPNDGAVWTNSAPYAEFKGVESGAWWCGGVTHFGIVDRGILVFPGFTPGFDAREFYRGVVQDLKNRGF